MNNRMTKARYSNAPPVGHPQFVTTAQVVASNRKMKKSLIKLLCDCNLVC